MENVSFKREVNQFIFLRNLKKSNAREDFVRNIYNLTL